MHYCIITEREREWVREYPTRSASLLAFLLSHVCVCVCVWLDVSFLTNMADAADDKPESWWQRNGDYVWEVIGYIAALLVIVAFFTSYGVVFGIFKSVGDGRKVDVFRNVIDNSTVAQPLLNITCTLSVTDSKYGVDVSLDLNCTTGLPDAIVLNTLFLATPFNVIFNRQLSTFSEGDVPGIVSQTIPWASGSVQDYPFDSYYADLSVRSVRGSLARSLIDLSECASLLHMCTRRHTSGV